jgi:rRNA-processing protein FCF1
MKSAYLDNNIIVDIEKGNISLTSIIENINDDISTIYYSSAHLHEANEITGTNEEIQSRLKTRFETLESVTNLNYLYHELPSNKVLKQNQKPTVVYSTINDVSFAQNAMKAMINLIQEEQKELIRIEMGLNPIEINNYKTNEVIEQLNKKLLSLGNYSFVGLIEKAIELHPNGNEFGLHNNFAAVFEMLDMLGYWTDKYNSKSNYARLWDSNHAYFASFCDYFISDDKRTRNKTKVAFNLYNINTCVKSSKNE